MSDTHTLSIYFYYINFCERSAVQKSREKKIHTLTHQEYYTYYVYGVRCAVF